MGTDLNVLIEEFYRLNYADKPLVTSFYSHDIPADMVITGPNLHRRVEWRLVKRYDYIDPRFEDFEAEIGYRLPESFKLWQSRYYILDGYAHILSLPISPTNDPFWELRHRFFNFRPEHVGQKGLIPFGEERIGIGPLCFDARHSVPEADWSILYFDHENPDPDEAIGDMLFSSFEKLLACCVHYLSLPGDDWAKQERIADFFEIDPTGAGGPGREYWEEWLED